MRRVFFFGFFFFIACPCGFAEAETHHGKKILLIHSYHAGYPWTDAITRAVATGLADSGVALSVHHMDTKRNRTSAFFKEAVMRAKAAIEKEGPDLVIAADDNAVRGVIVPYYKDQGLPVVFCGVNWDASLYGLPAKNITGMVEIEPLKAVVDQLRSYAKGNRIGFLCLNSYTAQKQLRYHDVFVRIEYAKAYLVGDFKDWKEKFLALQTEVDMLIIDNPFGMADWDADQFFLFAREHTRIPTGTTAPWRVPYALLGYVEIPEEQGRWAAQTALKILDGVSPASIPVATNHETTLIINQTIAEKLGIVFPPDIFNNAEVIRP